MAMDSEAESNIPDSLLVHKATPEYLQELLKDKKQLQSFPNTFVHLEIILEKEISRVREKLFHLNSTSNKSESGLPEPNGSITTLQEKVFVPVKENPNYNFVGRLLGPRGLTAKQLEQDLECKIMVRGRGSLRDKKKEDMNRGKPNWEHLEEELHVLVSVEDFENRASVKIHRAAETIRAFLEQGVRTPENEDRLKQLQLMELAVLNDKDRQQAHAQQQLQQQQSLILQHQHTLTTVLNSQAAAAAAAQLMGQPSQVSLTAFPSGAQQQQQQQLLARYQSGTLSPLAAASSALVSNANGSPGVQSSYSSVPTSFLCSLGAGAGGALGGVSGASASSASSAGWGSVAANGLGFSLAPQFQVAASVPANLTALSYPAMHNSVSPNLISCTPSVPAGQDQLAAITAALLTAGNGSSFQHGGLQLANGSTACPTTTNQRLAVAAAAAAAAVAAGKSVVYQGAENPAASTAASQLPVAVTMAASQLLDQASLLEYQNAVAGTTYELSSETLKLRSVPSGSASSQTTRMHPYVRH